VAGDAQPVEGAAELRPSSPAMPFLGLVRQNLEKRNSNRFRGVYGTREGRISVAPQEWRAMKRFLVCAGVTLILIRVPLQASGPRNTDAQCDGLIGPVQSISTKVERTQLDWRQPDGPAVVLGVGCQECEYDVEGNRIKSGQILNGEFRGDFTRILRNETGQVTEKIEENYKGELVRREVMGAYGITEEDFYEKGKQTSRTTLSYDGNGHVAESYHFDQNGAEIESSFSISDASGNFKEQWDYGRNGAFLLHFLQTYDPKRDITDFTNFNEDGTVKLAFRTEGTKVLSFWQQPGENGGFGSTFFMDPVGKTQESYSCHQDGTCDHIFSYFVDEARHLLSRVEWHDAAGLLKLSADYEYETDLFGNWTKRTVWVWRPELGERKLYETDYRTLKYWNK
jgi:hypothetical protein